MDNLPRILFYLFLFIVVLPVCILFISLFLKGKKQAWKGEIIDKKETSSRDFDTDVLQYNYTIIVKLEDGKERKIAVDKGRYDKWDIGDKIEKKAGEIWPEKI